MLERILDPEQFLSARRAVDLAGLHLANPYVWVGDQRYSVTYTPAESANRMFGGNSNWRGPVWMPMNFMFVQALSSYAAFLGDTFLVADPTRSADEVPLRRSSTTTSRGGSPACSCAATTGDGRPRRQRLFQTDPHWRDLVPFHEYFDGDTGRGVGASHQTGWTALVAGPAPVPRTRPLRRRPTTTTRRTVSTNIDLSGKVAIVTGGNSGIAPPSSSLRAGANVVIDYVAHPRRPRSSSAGSPRSATRPSASTPTSTHRRGRAGAVDAAVSGLGKPRHHGEQRRHGDPHVDPRDHREAVRHGARGQPQERFFIPSSPRSR